MSQVSKECPKNYLAVYMPTIFVIGFSLGLITLLIAMEKIKPGNFRSLSNEYPVVMTNQEFIEDARSHSVDLNSEMTVFDLVFSQLPENVIVYPTENYYYFKFYSGGREIWGNFRFEVEDRKEGKLSFAYFNVLNRSEWPFSSESFTKYRLLTADDGVVLHEVDPFKYQVTYQDRTVTFNLNQIAQSWPDNMLLRDNEVFVSRIFDESGWQLVLIFDEEQPAFRFVLDESAVMPDLLDTIDDQVLVGRRSGFAFFEDKEADRLVLIGVDNANISVNNYYDGPFDQLADNYVADDTFKNYAERAFPGIKDKINQRGIFLDENGQAKNSRLSLQPHLKYYSIDHLRSFVTKCRMNATGKDVVRCLTQDQKQASSN